MADMGNIMDTFGQIMSDPDAKQKLSGMAEALGLGDLLGSVSGTGETKAVSSGSSATPDIAKIQNALSTISASDPRLGLLRALKPFIGGKRAESIDNISRIMQVGTVASTMGLFNNTKSK